MPSSLARIAENLRQVQGRIADAAIRSGRRPSDIKLVAVTKYAGDAAVQALVAAGCHDLAESRPQQLWQRAALFPSAQVRWHLVGHLQRNKVARTLPLVSMIHSLDSLRLAQAIDSQASHAPYAPVDALLEVNISGDTAKHGFAPAELEPLAGDLVQCPRVRIGGLMAMAGLGSDSERARRDFAALRQLRDKLRASWPSALVLDELSMGMSADFEEAIEEGATIIRLGSLLFAGLEPH